MWYRYSRDLEPYDEVLDREEYYNDLSEQEINQSVFDHGANSVDDLEPLPRSKWDLLNYPYVKETLHIHWLDPERRIYIPRKIMSASEDRIVLSPMWGHGSYDITHEDEALVHPDDLWHYDERYGIQLY